MDAAAAWLTDEQMGLTALLLQSHQEVFHRSLLPSNGEEPSLRLRCQELFACGFPVLAYTTAMTTVELCQRRCPATGNTSS